MTRAEEAMKAKANWATSMVKAIARQGEAITVEPLYAKRKAIVEMIEEAREAATKWGLLWKEARYMDTRTVCLFMGRWTDEKVKSWLGNYGRTLGPMVQLCGDNQY